MKQLLLNALNNPTTIYKFVNDDQFEIYQSLTEYKAEKCLFIIKQAQAGLVLLKPDETKSAILSNSSLGLDLDFTIARIEQGDQPFNTHSILTVEAKDFITNLKRSIAKDLMIEKSKSAYYAMKNYINSFIK